MTTPQLDPGGLTYTPATVLAHLIRDRQISPVELVEATLRRIEAAQPVLNVFITVAADQALAAAREAERAIARGDRLARDPQLEEAPSPWLKA